MNGVAGEDYDKHTGWFGVDNNDGMDIVDYLGNSARAMLGGFTGELIHDAYAFICTELEQFRQEGNEKLADRYSRLKDYYLSRCPELPKSQ